MEGVNRGALPVFWQCSPTAGVWMGIPQPRGRRLSAARKCFQPAAFCFGKGNHISGCHAPIIQQQKSAVNMRNVTCYIVLVRTAATHGDLIPKGLDHSAHASVSLLTQRQHLQRLRTRNRAAGLNARA